MEWRKMRRLANEAEEEACRQVLRDGKRGVLAMYGENGYPYALPMNFYYDEGRETVYFHGAREGAKVDLLKQNDKVCFTLHDDGFIPDGEWAYRLTSVVIRGRIRFVTNYDEAVRAIQALGLKYYPTRESVDAAITRSMGRVAVMALSIDHMTGKRIKEA